MRQGAREADTSNVGVCVALASRLIGSMSTGEKKKHSALSAKQNGAQRKEAAVGGVELTRGGNEGGDRGNNIWVGGKL